MIRNRIVTLGFSRVGKNLIVSRGFAPKVVEQITEQVIHYIRGNSDLNKKYYKRCDEYYMNVKLISVNNKDIKNINGRICVTVCEDELVIKADQRIRTKVLKTLNRLLIKVGIKWK
jgi:hypothetical protein